MAIFLTVAMICALQSIGCVAKDAYVTGHRANDRCTLSKAPRDGMYTLWPRREWPDVVWGRPCWMKADEPWEAMKLYSVELRKGDRIGFRHGSDGKIIAVSGETEWALPQDSYSWFRRQTALESSIEMGVAAPARFAGGTILLMGVASNGYGMGRP